MCPPKKIVDTIVVSGHNLSKVGWLNAYAFEENEEDLPGIVEEFFGAESEVAGEPGDGMAPPDHAAKPSLAEKLERKAAIVEPAVGN